MIQKSELINKFYNSDLPGVCLFFFVLNQINGLHSHPIESHGTHRLIDQE